MARVGVEKNKGMTSRRRRVGAVMGIVAVALQCLGAALWPSLSLTLDCALGKPVQAAEQSIPEHDLPGGAPHGSGGTVPLCPIYQTLQQAANALPPPAIAVVEPSFAATILDVRADAAAPVDHRFSSAQPRGPPRSS